MSARKAKRPPKARTFEAIEREHETAMKAVKVALDKLTPLNDEIQSHPAYRNREEQAKREREAKEKAERRAREQEYRKRLARWPMAKNPLTDEDFSQSVHNVRCFADYVSRLTVEDEGPNQLTEDTLFGKYLLDQVLVTALDALVKQEAADREEQRERLEAAVAKAKGGAS